MARPPDDPSAFEEPHVRGGFRPDPSEKRAERNLGRSAPTPEQAVEHSVWDEPGLSHELAGGVPEDGVTYGRWLEERLSEVDARRSWATVLIIVLAAGPFAVLGTLMGVGGGSWGIVILVVMGPVAEEVMKIALPLWVVERRPFLFRSAAQILVCALLGGLAFAAIENLVYLHVYVPDPPPGLVRWRWTVCMALHACCSVVAALGLVKVWRDTWQRRARPRLHLAYPYMVLAVVLHGAYNALAIVLEVTGYVF